jgi:hypothetical protein
MNENIRTLLLRLGKAQIDAMFARQDEGPAIDDSEFLPLVEVVLTAFEKTDCGNAVVEELWRYAYAVYDGICKDGEPESTTDENRELMQSYFLGKHRWQP